MCCGPHCSGITVVDPPKKVYRDVFHPQLVEVVHPIEVVTRHHFVPVYRHICKYEVRDECDNNNGPHHDKGKDHHSWGHKPNGHYSGGYQRWEGEHKSGKDGKDDKDGHHKSGNHGHKSEKSGYKPYISKAVSKPLSKSKKKRKKASHR